MNELKPIEEGCLAVGINCKVKSNNGKFFRVGKYLGLVERFGSYPQWEVDRQVNTIHGYRVNHISEHLLLRIDDPDLKKEEEEELVYIENDQNER